VKARVLLTAVGFAILAMPNAVHAQAIARGAQEGAAVGNRAAGRVGAAVGSVIGGASFGIRSGVNSLLGFPQETGTVQRHRASQKKRIVHR
jgi:hypothetical protein